MIRGRRRTILLAAGALALPLACFAQRGKLRRIGFLGNSTAALEANLVAPFREGLREHGYVEGENAMIEYRWAEGKYERFPALIAELLASKVEVIVTAGTPATLAIKKATQTVPLVMIAVGDPVGTAIVPSLSRPGGNITGLTSIADDLDGKRLELLKEVFPDLSHVAVLWNSVSPLQAIQQNRALILAVAGAGALAAALPLHAQQRTFRVGFISSGREADGVPFLAAFRDGMRELRYVEGRNLAPQVLWGEGSQERVDELAADLVASRPDVIVTLALAGKRIELLKEVLPGLRRVAVVAQPQHPGDLGLGAVRGRRQPHDLRPEPARIVSPSRDFRRPDTERREAGRASGRTSDARGIRGESQDREGAWRLDPAVDPAARGPGDRVNAA